MSRNISLLTFILPLNYTWFWSGIWLLYYLRFTDFAGVGLLYGIMVPLGMILEIPTGAISDLIGKKRTLILAFFFNGLASLFIGLSTNFNELLISVMFSVIAGAFYSGTAEALIYDSLKDDGKESIFDRVFAQISTASLVITAAASIAGGFLYNIDVQYPWFARAFFLLIGMILCLFLTEPKIDSEKFSFKNFINQNKQSFLQIFGKRKSILERKNFNKIIILLITLSFIYIITEEIESGFALEIGHDAEQMGLLFAAISLVSAAGYHFYPFFKRKFSESYLQTFVIVSILISALVSPLLGLISGTAILLGRSFLSPFIKIISSETLNNQIESKYRATALSTFSLLVSLPYALSPIIVGEFVNQSTPSRAIMYITLTFIIILALVTTYLNVSATKER